MKHGLLETSATVRSVYSFGNGGFDIDMLWLIVWIDVEALYLGLDLGVAVDGVWCIVSEPGI